MILAAGLGTRLKPITDKIPKALVEVDGVPMLERVILNLKNQGFNYIVVNVHHFSEMVKDYLNSKDFGIEIQVSDESDELLDTGGGIVKASRLLFKEDDSPVLIHNVDILSNARLEDVLEQISRGETEVSLLVSDRPSTRKLLFNEEMDLLGWHDLKNEVFRPVDIKGKEAKELAFSGIYAVSKKGVEEMEKKFGEGRFPVMDYFLDFDREARIKGIEQEGLQLIDIGKPATLSQASQIFKDRDKFVN